MLKIWKAFGFSNANGARKAEHKNKSPQSDALLFVFGVTAFCIFSPAYAFTSSQEPTKLPDGCKKGQTHHTTPTILRVPSLKLEPLITYSAATHFLIRVGWNYYSNRIKLLLWHWLILPSFSTFLSPTVLNKKVRITKKKKTLLKVKLPATIWEHFLWWEKSDSLIYNFRCCFCCLH